MQGSNQSYFLMHGSLNEGNTTLSSQPYPNLNASKDLNEVSPNSLKHNLSIATQKGLASLNARSRSNRMNYQIADTQSHETQKQKLNNHNSSEHSQGAGGFDIQNEGNVNGNMGIQIGHRNGQQSQNNLDQIFMRQQHETQLARQQRLASALTAQVHGFLDSPNKHPDYIQSRSKFPML